MTDPLPPLLEPEDLAGLDGGDVLLVHVAQAPAFEQAHLPGALLVEPAALVSGLPPAPGKLPDRARLQALFTAIGYRPDRQVVVYDDEGGGWAGRFIWTLDIIGHQRWAYLNGGLQAWHAAGLPLESGPCVAHSTAGEPLSLTLDPAPVAGLEDAMAAMNDPRTIIWDVRSPAEYRGEKSGSRRAGHIPTAVNLDWMRLKDPARDLRLVEDLRGLLAAHGIEPDMEVITHCQSHHRSGLSYLAGRLLGFRRIRAYDGSWAEWGSRDDTPVVTGSEPGDPPSGGTP